MAKFTPYALTALPSTGIDVNGLYFIKGTVESKFKIYLRKSDNSDWVSLGTVNSVDTVNNLTGNVKVDLDFTNGVLKIVATGDGTQSTVASINLDARYRKTADSINWADITGVPDFAMDSTVVHKTGAETIADVKTFTSIPVLPASNPTTDNQAVRKKYVDDADGALQTQINSLEVVVNSGVKVPLPLDCSANPNYPASSAGDQYKVTAAGKIGGASGISVELNDTIICTETNAGGTQATVGTKFYITQSNVDQATETVRGISMIATQAKVDTGTDDEAYVTAKKLQVKLNANNASEQTANNGKYVRHDTASQGLSTTNKANARTNIGAADDAVVVKTSGNQTVGGTKTFSSIPVGPTADPTTDNQLARKKYVDDQVTDAVKWGGTSGKEW